MNTLAKLYKQSLSLFNSDPSSKQAESSLIDLVSAYAADPYPAIVDIIQKDEVKETTKGFWRSLEEYGLCMRFVPRQDGRAFAILKYLKPEPPAETEVKIIVYSVAKQVAA